MEKIASRILIIWMTIVLISICSLINEMDSEYQQFYQFGPNDNLIIFGLRINTYFKYYIVLSYCCVNSLMRTTHVNVLIPWQTNCVQDTTLEKQPAMHCFAYEITYVIIVYNWVDWYIYMNILLAQVDMLLIEITCDMIMSGVIARYYLNHKIIKIDDALEQDEVFNPLRDINDNDNDNENIV